MIGNAWGTEFEWNDLFDSTAFDSHENFVIFEINWSIEIRYKYWMLLCLNSN